MEEYKSKYRKNILQETLVVVTEDQPSQKIIAGLRELEKKANEFKKTHTCVSTQQYQIKIYKEIILCTTLFYEENE